MKFWDRSHEPIFRETTVHYIFMWAAAAPIDVRSVAAKLLAAGIAEPVGSPAYPEVRISPQLAKLGNHLNDLKRIKEVINLHRWRDLARWMIRNPRLAAKLILLLISNRELSTRTPKHIQDDLGELEQEIKKIVWNAQLINAIQHSIESDLYASAYLSDEPYLRLTLHGL